MFYRALPIAALLLLLISGTSPAAQSGAALSPRNANYTIEVKLDPAQKMLHGREWISWRNDGKLPAGELRFHLYWNAWKNDRSTWMREESLGAERTHSNLRQEDWSYSRLISIRLLPGPGGQTADLTCAAKYIAPDDGNPEDQTVMALPLAQPVLPGQTISLEVVWDGKIPRSFSRTGYRGQYYFIAQWFPKLGVFQADGSWNCHQFHASSEFFSDFGAYDVKMTIPRGWILGATGTEQGIEQNADGTATHRFCENDVHDFAWTTSPDYREARREFAYPGLKSVQMRLLYQPEHEAQVDRHFRATAVALQNYGTWYGEYPYGHITIVDPAWGTDAEGMEYPTLFTCGTQVFNPLGGGAPEAVTVHEAGHQFWYGIVANNEFEDAWLDEGLNSFSTARALEAGYGEEYLVRRYFRQFFPIAAPQVRFHRMTDGNGLDGYRAAARSDIESTPNYLYFPSTATEITYSKTALWLSTLENMLGWDTLQRTLSLFFRRWSFKHPRPDDFFATVNEVSGRDLTSFFDQVYRKAAVFDYAVESVKSENIAVDGFEDRDGAPVPAKGKPGDSGPFETSVVIRRLQDGILPVEVLLKFENGEELRQSWDGEATWKLIRVTKPVRLSYAAVDPERKILLDINFTNNSRLLTPKPKFAATKWASKWMIWLQDYMQSVAFLL